MKKSWSFTDENGQKHSIEYKAGFGLKLIVDGTTYKLKSQSKFINVIDYYVRIAGTGINLVAIGNKVDVAVGGIFIGSGEPYEPVQVNTPAWVWVLVGVSVLVGGLLNGAIGAALAAVFSTLYVSAAFSKQMGKVVLGFIGCMVVQFAILGLKYFIYSAL